ncbi:MAG: PLP-dependent aspartate aminotransferase family protein, partial [Candidatus Sumerlaeota bacterium]|nr:PLP-dependent aspartate aminotransferase family protein [Candidatus Sumerlaeota bacterium]
MSKNEDPSQWGESTLAIHGPGRLPKAHHSVSTPIIQTSNYYFDTSAELIEYMDAKLQGRQLREAEYGRYGNPTQTETQRKLAALEGAERALIFSSGMAAVILPLLTFAKPDGHVVFTDDCYRQTREFADRMLKKFNVPYSLAKPDIASIEAAIRPNTNILFSETPTNPYMRCIDLPKLVALAKRRRCMTMIDSTLATPYNLRPIEQGVDLVIHSATKYLGGHNDLVAGVLCGSKALVDEVFRFYGMIGPIPGALTCFLLERGLKTFPMRMKQHNANGLAVARALEGHPKIERVFYHGLESHR